MDTIDWGTSEYFVWLGLLVFGRGMDFLSTWIATPGLVLEANPLARKLGWKWGTVFNLAVCLVVACLPLGAIAVSCTSLLVASHNFQWAWLMRTAGEESFRDWYVDRLEQTPLRLYLFCLAGQTVLVGFVGAALLVFSGDLLVPLGIGMGIVVYAIAVTFYTLLSLWRIRRPFIRTRTRRG